MANIDTYNYFQPPIAFTAVTQQHVATFGPYPGPVYLMRAILSGSYVYWTSSGSPDASGALSGYNPGSLSDIVNISRH